MSMSGRPARRRGTLALLTLLAIGPSVAPARAHEIGTTRVSVVVSEAGRYQIEVRTDAASLLEKLESVAGDPATDATTDSTAWKQRFERLSATFQQRVVVAFDGRPAPPAISWSVSAPTAVGGPPVVTILIGGQAPARVHHLTWTYAWTFTSYPFSVQRADGTAATEWLQGDQTSTPVQLDVAA